MRQQLGYAGGPQRGTLHQIFTREIDLSRLESLVETDLSQLQLFDSKEHEKNLKWPGGTPTV